jgi:hypothetical protein
MRCGLADGATSPVFRIDDIKAVSGTGQCLARPSPLPRCRSLSRSWRIVRKWGELQWRSGREGIILVGWQASPAAEMTSCQYAVERSTIESLHPVGDLSG